MPKPTIYMAFTDIAAITFSRATSANSSTKMFEMKFNLRSGTEYSFSSIPREEHAALEAFCRMKNLPIRSEIADEGPRAYIGSSDDEGGRMKRTKPDYQDDMESESEDEDFKGAVGSDESDVAEEFNEDYSSSSGEEQEGGENASNQGAPASPAQASPKIAKHVSILPKSKPAKKPQEASSSQPKKQKDSASFEKPAKKRAKKDPNAPKRALSAFILFSQAMRASILAETPGASIGDVAKALGVKWKAISAEDRAPFDALAIEEKERYAAQMAAYKSEDKPSASVSAPAKKASPSKTEHKSAEMVESDSE